MSKNVNFYMLSDTSPQAQKLEGLIQSAQESMDQIYPGHWLHKYYLDKRDQLKDAYRIITGREYDDKHDSTH